jgi:MFS family permease
MGTVKTVASDIAKGNEKVEIQAMQLIIGMWAWGFLISPVISGALAEPMRQYPQWTEWLQNSNDDTIVWAATILTRHPFLLPNLLGSALCLVAMFAVWLFVPEPVPVEKRRSVRYMLGDFWEAAWSWPCLPAKCRTCCAWAGPYQSVPVQNNIRENDDDCVLIHQERSTKIHLPWLLIHLLPQWPPFLLANKHVPFSWYTGPVALSGKKKEVVRGDGP